jgi:hypothetical protein
MFDKNIDLPMWMSSLSLDDKSVPFYQQKEDECKEIKKMSSAKSAGDKSS